MRLVIFTKQGEDPSAARIGLIEGEEVLDLQSADPSLPASMRRLLAGGEAALGAVRSAAASASRSALSEARLRAPIQRPPKILAVGLNYADHIAETGRAAPEVPMIFNKQSTSIIGPGEEIHVPRASSMVDFEGELAFVIGRRCRHVPRDRAPEVIVAYTVGNDVSVRDWQMRVPTFTMGKSWDTHCPLGPALVTADEIAQPHALDIQTWVNDELMQSSNTRELIFDCYALVEHLSTAFTLEPGDVVLTGTPHGVGVARQPPRFLRPGDRVRVAIEGLGALENPVVAEPEHTAFID